MYAFVLSGDAQHHNGEHVIETGNENQIAIVIEPCILLHFKCNLHLYYKMYFVLFC